MPIAPAAPSDLPQAVQCLAAAFAQDPITRFLLGSEPGYPERLTGFFSLLMRARLALGMPVLLARDGAGIQGAAMGYTPEPPDWPDDLNQAWDAFEGSIPALPERIARYEEIAERFVPAAPHHYLGVLGVEPALQGRGFGQHLLTAFCDLAAADRASSGVYLETANPANVRLYERAGFKDLGRGRLGDATLWCMFRDHGCAPITTR